MRVSRRVIDTPVELRRLHEHGRWSTRSQTEYGIDDEDPSESAAPVLARFRAVDRGRSIVRAWADDFEVTIVMLIGSLRLATNTSTARLERDDVVALGSEQRYALANDAASTQPALFVELWMRRTGALQRELHHVTTARYRRVRALVELVPRLGSGPRVFSKILGPNEVVTEDVPRGDAVYVVTTVGTASLNDLPVAPLSAALFRGPGRATIRAHESTEVLLVPLRHPISRPT